MAHKTLVGGTAYEISGGKTMVGGTVYDIAGGKTMVDGTVYEIAFAPSTITVNITGSGSSQYAYVTVNGTKYTTATTIECEAGTEISIKVSGTNITNSQKSQITLNGTVVASGTTSGAVYSFAPDTDVVNIELTKNGSGLNTYYTATITTS